MKKLFLIATSFSLLFAFSPLTLADEPKSCPSVDLIRAGGLNNAFFNCHDASYIITQQNTYGSKTLWNFFMMPIEAPFGPSGEKEAMQKGLMALQSLYGNPQPKYNPTYGWQCDYRVQDPTIEVFAFVGGN